MNSLVMELLRREAEHQRRMRAWSGHGWWMERLIAFIVIALGLVIGWWLR